MSSTTTQSPPGEISLSPMTMMDFLDPSTLTALLSPAILEGNNPPLPRARRRGGSVDAFSPGNTTAAEGPSNTSTTTTTGYGEDRTRRKTAVTGTAGLGLIPTGEEERVDQWNGQDTDDQGSSSGQQHVGSQHGQQQQQRHHPSVEFTAGSSSSTTDFFDFDLGGYGMDAVPGPSFSNPTGTTLNIGGSPRDRLASSNTQIQSHPQPQSQSQSQEPAATSARPDWTMQSEGDDVNVGTGAYNAMGIEGLDAEVGQELQRQLEQIHMQSPAIFASLKNPGHFNSHSNHPGYARNHEFDHRIPPPNRMMGMGMGMGIGMSVGPGGVMMGKGFSGANGLITPAQSSEILANIHEGLVSPLPMTHSIQDQDGTFAINHKGEIIFTPLLSPAITQPSDSSNTSPHFGSNASSNGAGGRDLSYSTSSSSQQQSGSSHGGSFDQHAQLQALQQQQLNIQRQLDAIQRSQQQQQQQQQQNQQERQSSGQSQQGMQNSPYVSPMINPQPNGGFGYQSSSRGTSTSHPTPNSDFFSPLTSPALDPVQMGFRSNHLNSSAQQQARNQGHARERSTPSAMSPGYINGMNNQYNGMPMMKVPDRSNVTLDQTLSPALLPQPDAWKHQPQSSGSGPGSNSSTSQAYLEELARMINSQEQPTSGPMNGEIGQPGDMTNNAAQAGAGMPSAGNIGIQEHMAARRRAATVGKSPALRPSRASTGRTRPSPMMKPTHRPGRGGSSTVPPSPLVAAYTPPTMPLSSRASQFGGRGEGSIGSESLSPVDLSQMIMPPPPPPSQSINKTKNVIKGKVAPITPATLMQMGSTVLSTSGPRRSSVAMNLKDGSGVVVDGDEQEEGHSGSSCGTPKSGKRSLSDVAEEPKTRFERLAAGWSASLRALRPTDASKAKVIRASKVNKPANEANIPIETKKSSHKAAEQRRRDSLKAGFDELRLLLPPINTEALDPETGEPIPGSSAPRLLPKSSLVPDDNPNKGVSKVALLKYSNEYIERMQGKLERRNNYIDLLKDAIQAIRLQADMSPDEHVDELLGYAFEDEDEDEEPTGASSAKLGKRPSLADLEEGEEAEEMHMDCADDAADKSSKANGRHRRKSSAATARPKQPRRKSSLMMTSADSSTVTSPNLVPDQQARGELQGLDIDMI